MLALLITMPVAITGCDLGCDTTLTAMTGTAHRVGSGVITAQIHLDVSAKLTSGGAGVGGVRIVFAGIMPGGTAVNAAGAVTGADGVARFSGPADYELANALTPVKTAKTISYVARTIVLGSRPAAKVCNLLGTQSQRADLRYQP